MTRILGTFALLGALASPGLALADDGIEAFHGNWVTKGQSCDGRPEMTVDAKEIVFFESWCTYVAPPQSTGTGQSYSLSVACENVEGTQWPGKLLMALAIDDELLLYDDAQNGQVLKRCSG